MKKLLILVYFLFSIGAFAGENPGKGTILLSGKVIDSVTGEALTGVKIRIKGTNTYCYSDMDGNFSLQANSALAGGEVSIDLAGYEPTTYKNAQLSLAAPISLNPR